MHATRPLVIHTAWFLVTVLMYSLPAVVKANDSTTNLDEQLLLARQLNATAHWRSGRSILEFIEPSLEGAGARQRNQYDLAMAHNLALGGSSGAGLELIEQILDRDPEPDIRLNALWLAANLAQAERRYHLAFSYLRDGLILMPEVSDPAARAGVLGVAGLLYAQAGEVSSGVELAERARQVAHQVDVDYPDSIRCISEQRLTAALTLDEDPEQTMDAALRALEQCRAERNGHFIAALESQIGQLHLDRGNRETARQWIETALQRQTEIGHRYGAMVSRLRLAHLAVSEQDFAAASELLEGLADEFRDRSAWDHQAKVHRLQARLAEERQDFAEAVHQLKLEAVAIERYHEWDRARRMAYLEVSFDIESRRQELALLREQARATELEETSSHQHESMRTIIQSGAGLMIVLLAVLLFRTTRERRHFRALSRCDSLTGLLNHTSFFEVADQSLNACIADGKPFTLVVADIDHFKKVNDTHGHLSGDTVLCRVAGRMRELFENPTILGRIGGEEFAIALPGSTIEVTQSRIELLRQRINRVRSDDNGIAVTVSFGLAEFNGTETIEQLRRRADHALYRAKKAGRNRLVSADI